MVDITPSPARERARERARAVLLSTSSVLCELSSPAPAEPPKKSATATPLSPVECDARVRAGGPGRTLFAIFFFEFSV